LVFGLRQSDGEEGKEREGGVDEKNARVWVLSRTKEYDGGRTIVERD